MREFTIPFGTDRLRFYLEPSKVDQVILSGLDTIVPEQDQNKPVELAMLNPVNGARLYELAKKARTAVIIISDHTRPVPSKYIIPHMLRELRQGNPDIDVTLLVATGFHRAAKREELISKLGEEIVQKEKISIHDCNDDNMLVKVGRLPSGASLAVNRLAYEADLLISEGFIEPHFFAGFSGGRKSVLPGVCSRISILENHCSKFIASPFSRAGVLKSNPINLDMCAAARMTGLRYIVNVVINSNKEIVAAFAGEPEAAHAKGCEFLGNYCRRASKKSQIVITSNGGHPLDQNIYQCVKGMTAAEACCGEDGVIIMAGACTDGCGGEEFYKALRYCESPLELLHRIEGIPMEQTHPDQWEYQILARILDKFTVIFVALPSAKKMITDMKMQYASTIDEALDKALQIAGKNTGISVIPDGVSVIVDG